MTDFALDMGLAELEFRKHARRDEVGPAATGMLDSSPKWLGPDGKQATDRRSQQLCEGYS